MIKWLFFMIAMLLIPLALYADGLCKKRLLYPDTLNEKLNRLLLAELQQRIPKERIFTFEEPPEMAPWDRLTDCVKCVIQLPKTKTEDPQEALEIFLPYAKAYVDTMNNVREVRPYFVTFPYSLDMWFLLVDFARDPKTDMFYYEPFLAGVEFDGGTFAVDRLEKVKRLRDGRMCTNIYETPKIFPKELQKLAIPHFDAKKEPTLIPETTKSCYPDRDHEKTFNFFKNFAKQNDLIVTALHSVFPSHTFQNYKICCLPGAFAAQEKYLTLEESKELVSKTREAFIQYPDTKERVENWVTHLRERGEEHLTPHINLQEYMGFRISFWDQYIDRVKPPHIAEIWVTGTKARYYVSDELQQLQLLHEEDLPSYDIEIPVPEELLRDKPKDK